MTPPILQALVLADQVYIDATTHKKVIAGTFNRVWAPSFPTVFERGTWAYICLTEVREPVKIQLRYVDAEAHQVLMEAIPVGVQATSALDSVELVSAVPPLPMPHEGVYRFEVYAADELIGSLRITASRREAEP